MLIDDKKAHTKLPQMMRAAIHLFVKKGIDGTTIKDIAKLAGVAEGALYRHFKGKDDLAWYLFSTHLDRFTADLMAAVYPLKTARARLCEFVRASFSAFEDDPELYSYLILQEHKELRKYVGSSVHPGHVVTKIIQDGQRENEVRLGDPMVLGSMFVGGIIRVCVLKMYGTIATALHEHIAEVSEMSWQLLRRIP